MTRAFPDPRASLQRVGHAFVLSLLAGLAVDFGFGPAFVDDTVGYLATVYCALLVALLVGRSGTHWSRLMLVRLPLALVVALLCVVSLRSWARVELPWGTYTTTGHSPYFLLPTVGVLLALIFEVLASFRSPSKSSGLAEPGLLASQDPDWRGPQDPAPQDPDGRGSDSRGPASRRSASQGPPSRGSDSGGSDSGGSDSGGSDSGGSDSGSSD